MVTVPGPIKAAEITDQKRSVAIFCIVLIEGGLVLQLLRGLFCPAWMQKDGGPGRELQALCAQNGWEEPCPAPVQCRADAGSLVIADFFAELDEQFAQRFFFDFAVGKQCVNFFGDVCSKRFEGGRASRFFLGELFHQLSFHCLESLIQIFGAFGCLRLEFFDFTIQNFDFVFPIINVLAKHQVLNLFQSIGCIVVLVKLFCRHYKPFNMDRFLIVYLNCKYIQNYGFARAFAIMVCNVKYPQKMLCNTLNFTIFQHF
ncbi:MAG: hypothetical protein H6695_11155 [Deferribacteres bacterium]|nr:hypothetical protein [candidate division KSB1 bacterium]MCB9510734.1 hypothetical protein [Deferribacteres bacterium]